MGLRNASNIDLCQRIRTRKACAPMNPVDPGKPVDQESHPERTWLLPSSCADLSGPGPFSNSSFSRAGHPQGRPIRPLLSLGLGEHQASLVGVQRRRDRSPPGVASVRDFRAVRAGFCRRSWSSRHASTDGTTCNGLRKTVLKLQLHPATSRPSGSHSEPAGNCGGPCTRACAVSFLLLHGECSRICDPASRPIRVTPARACTYRWPTRLQWILSTNRSARCASSKTDSPGSCQPP